MDLFSQKMELSFLREKYLRKENLIRLPILQEQPFCELLFSVPAAKKEQEGDRQ